jgi:predicted permease
VNGLIQDARYGLRTMLRKPGLTLVAVLSLALGIGANTAIFTLVNAVMLRALPVHDPARLVLLGAGSWRGSMDEFPDRSWQLFSYPFYRDLRQHSEVFGSVAAIQSEPSRVHAVIAADADPERVEVNLVSGSYFSTLGVTPVAGRVLSESDDQTPGGHPIAVASYSFWSRRFGRDPGILGKTLHIGSTAYSIVGVAPPEFFGTMVGESPDLWIPLAMEAQIPPGWKGLNDDSFQSLYVIGRLKPGRSAQEAEAEVNVRFKDALRARAGLEPTQKQVEDIRHARIDVTSAAAGLSQLRIQFSTPLRILMAVVALVLMIACANIANLLLARATTRGREMAVRLAMGARRARLIRQLLTESLLLAGAGGTLGIAMSFWGSRLLLRMVSVGQELVPLDLAPDGRVLAFTLGVCLVTAFLFGAAPAFRATRVDLHSSLKEGRGGSYLHARTPLVRALISSQVALSLTLLVGAGLFVRSLAKLGDVDTGFDKRNVLLFDLDSASSGYLEDDRLGELYRSLEGRVAAIPGVEAASFSLFTFNQGAWTADIWAQGYAPGSENERSVSHNVVGARFFATMGLPVLVGRTFGPEDGAKAPKVAIINETFSRRLSPNRSPLGRRFGLEGPEHSGDVEIVGVVKDAKYESLRETPHAVAYYPYAQRVRYLDDFEVRFSGDPRSVASEVRRAISEVDRNLEVSGVTTLAEQVDQSVVHHMLIARLSSFFGLVALLLACMGIYGLASYGVARRTNEIGIRMALGAERPKILWLVMRENLVLVGAGLAAGVPAALASDRLVSSMLFGLTSTDPATLSVAVLVMLTVGVAAGYLPARRACLVQPMLALRDE